MVSLSQVGIFFLLKIGTQATIFIIVQKLEIIRLFSCFDFSPEEQGFTTKWICDIW